MTKKKFKVLYKEQKGTMSSLSHCNCCLVSAISYKGFLWNLWASELKGMTFIDTQLYFHQMTGMKHFILADIMKNIFLLHYQQDRKMLRLRS